MHKGIGMDSLRVEVVYALADAQDVVVLDLAEGAVARMAVSDSGLLARHGLAIADLQLGMFGNRIAPEQRLREGDRVEILRTLASVPNEARRGRARRNRPR